MNAKQMAFVNEYLQCFNATQAAIVAGYSERSAGQIGGRLLTNDEIRAAIDAELNASSMMASEVLMRLAVIGRNDDHQGQIKALVTLARIHRLEHRQVEVKFDGNFDELSNEQLHRIANGGKL